MKTTVEIDDALLRKAKRAAIDRGLSLRALLEAALRRELASTAEARRQPLTLVTRPGRLPAGVDISSREKMWEWFERGEATDLAPDSRPAGTESGRGRAVRRSLHPAKQTATTGSRA